VVKDMTQFNDDDTQSMDVTNESEIMNELRELDSRNKNTKSVSNVMRQIEIMRENKLLKSCIDDIYEY